jgi:hypothetical protein
MEAVIAGIFEIIYPRTRERTKPKLASMLGLIAHLWLTPFVGSAQADALVDEQLPPVRNHFALESVSSSL